MPLEDPDLKVEVVSIKDITPIKDKDRIELVWLYNKAPNGEPCIVEKGKHKVGELVVYIPPDHVVPDAPPFAFLNKGKPLTDGCQFVNKKNQRVRAMKMAGCVSHGLIITMSTADGLAMAKSGLGVPSSGRKEGSMIGECLGVTRWEPYTRGGVGGSDSKLGKEHGPINFVAPKYDLDNLRKLGDIFDWDGKESTYNLVVTEKLHGCCARYVVTEDKLPPVPAFFRKIKRLFFKPKMSELRDATHKLHVSSRTVWRGTEKDHQSVWKEIAEKHALFSKLKGFPNLVFYGEIIGRRIQGDGFTYGLKNDDIDFYVFDIYDPILHCWMNWKTVSVMCEDLGLKTVPAIYIGKVSKDTVSNFVDGRSTLDSSTMREGIVVKTTSDQRLPSGERAIVKWKSEEFLQKHG